jgi:hypothetical protein
MSKRNACVQLDYRAPSLGGVRARRPCRPRLSPKQQEEAINSLYVNRKNKKIKNGQEKRDDKREKKSIEPDVVVVRDGQMEKNRKKAKARK